MADRDELGRLLPGHSLPGPGRPPRKQEDEILAAIKEALPPELIKQKLQKALEIAEAAGSARGMIAVLEFAAAYSLGRPTVRVEQGNNNFAMMSEMLQGAYADAMEQGRQSAAQIEDGQGES